MWVIEFIFINFKYLRGCCCSIHSTGLIGWVAELHCYFVKGSRTCDPKGRCNAAGIFLSVYVAAGGSAVGGGQFDAEAFNFPEQGAFVDAQFTGCCQPVVVVSFERIEDSLGLD